MLSFVIYGLVPILMVGIGTCLYWISFFNLEWGVDDFLG